MPFNSDLLGAMPATVTWSPYTGVDTYGNPTYGTATSVQCTYTATKTRGTAGRQDQTSGPAVQYSYSVYVPPGTFTERDKIVLADGTVTFVQSVQTYPDPIYGDPYIQVAQTMEER